MLESGRFVPRVLSRRPELLPQAAPVFAGYIEIDRDGYSGRPLFRGMTAVLDELGITDREERKLWRSLWREMANTEAEVREKQREADAPAQGKAGRGKPRAQDFEED